MLHRIQQFSIATLVVAAVGVMAAGLRGPGTSPPAGRSLVEFWHFWGGADRAVVEDVVRRFNQSQTDYWVRAIAVPGNNFDAKLFLAIAGGSPPDLVNQDDPVVADWFERGAVEPIDALIGPEETKRLEAFLLPAARRLGRVGDRLVAVPNGLDLRLLYYNRTELERRHLDVPRTIDEFNRVIDAVTPPGTDLRGAQMVAFLPDPRRLWTWGYVFGGNFFDASTGRATLDSPPIVAALQWMVDRCRSFGADGLAAFRRGDQSLPGKTFPLLPTDDDATTGRYLFILDGQWRVRDIEAFQRDRRARGLSSVDFGVCSLPYPAAGPARPRSGWVNGNFFLVPRGARNPQGAWRFIQFWIGLDDPIQAAATCRAGGWIPVSSTVVETREFQAYLAEHPLMAEFVTAADSPHLYPYPAVAGGMHFLRETQLAAEYAINHPNDSASRILHQANQRIQAQRDAQMRGRSRDGEAP